MTTNYRPFPSRPDGSSFGVATMNGMLRRGAMASMGYARRDTHQPVIGIAQTWSEFNNCNVHLREVAQAVKRGVEEAGGLALEFPTISLGELFLWPTSMLYRNLMAMDTEEMIRGLPIDGVVLLCNCDKTTPAQLMGAASADIPAIVLTGGPNLPGEWRGRNLGACTDCRRLWNEYRAGNLTASDMDEVEANIYPGHGHCTVMGTASTMACIAEGLGMALPGSATPPANSGQRLQFAAEAGRTIVQAVAQDRRPSRIMTSAAFDNAIRLLMALGGSTNGVIHLLAIAGRLGIPLDLRRFDDLSATTPLLVGLKPSGTYHMPDLNNVGGVPAVQRQLASLLNLETLNISGQMLAEIVAMAPEADGQVIALKDKPLQAEGGLVVLFGNLAPRGALIKQSASSPALLRHRGPAVVFSSVEDMERRIDDPALPITPDSVLVLQNAGPVGAPGMPEAGFLPIPKRLLAQGVRDMVRLSDARMSGTAFGTVVLHICPEAAIGGPLAAVQEGDMIELDVPGRRLHLDVDDETLAARLKDWRPLPSFARGYWKLYVDQVQQADQGCDFAFLRNT